MTAHSSKALTCPDNIDCNLQKTESWKRVFLILSGVSHVGGAWEQHGTDVAVRKTARLMADN